MEFANLTPLWFLLAIPILIVAMRLSLVDRPRRLFVASVVLRIIGVILLVLALCRPTTRTQSDRVHVSFLVDVSASVDLGSAITALDDIDRAIERLEAGDGWSLHLLADRLIRVADSEEARETLTAWRTSGGDVSFRAESDLAGAIEVIRLGLPADRGARVVLHSDGKPTTERLEETIDRLREERVDVVFAPIAGLDEPEAAVVSLVATPARAFEGEPVRLNARLLSNSLIPAEVRVIHRGVVVARRDVELQPDEPTDVEFVVPMVTPGRSLWEVEIAPEQDFFAVNNKASRTIDVSGRPRVLVIHREPREMRAFERAMERQELVVETRPPRGLPRRLDELLAFDAVILADAPAIDLEPESLELLRSYVSDFAGGLAMFGSENSFGLGGYYRTPVEEVLPLISRFEKEREQPSMAMVLVIDKSGSMTGLPIAMARQAAKSATELIGPRDQIGVVGFDGRPFVASPLTYGSNKEAVKASIDRISPGGGTFMYSGMNEARAMLEGAHAQIKHMIVLGDGMTQQADHDMLVRAMLDRGITVSMVALGAGADRALMSRLAEIGRGRYYETNDPANVPQIFTRETVQASRSAIKEDLFASIKIADHPILEASGDLPFSLGFVMTRAKPTARVLLVTETGEPLLAVNNYGLGAALAFTGDLTPRWGAEWLAWPQFGQFWAGAVRAIIRRPDANGTHIEHATLDGELHISLSDTGAGAGREVRRWQGEALGEFGQGVPFSVMPVGLGRHEATVPVNEQSRSTIRLHDPDGGVLHVLHHDRTYPQEYNLASRTPDVLLAAQRFEPDRIRDNVEARTVPRRLTPWLLLMACLTSICGLLLRRL